MSSKGRADLFIVFVDFRGGARQESAEVPWAPDVVVVPSKKLRRVRLSNFADGWFCLAEDLVLDHQNRWDIIEHCLD